MKPLEERIHKLIQEEVTLAPYDPRWAELFRREKKHLRACLPRELVGRIEHFGSTAVPGLASKPVIDMLVEVTDLEETRQRIAPLLESQGYEYFWRPTWGNDTPPYYAWFIKRNAAGTRTHHIHMVEPQFEHWNRLLFRDYLIDHPETAQAYESLKRKLVNAYPNDRVAYTQGKTAFIVDIMEKTKRLRGTDG